MVGDFARVVRFRDLHDTIHIEVAPRQDVGNMRRLKRTRAIEEGVFERRRFAKGLFLTVHSKNFVNCPFFFSNTSGDFVKMLRRFSTIRRVKKLNDRGVCFNWGPQD